MDVKKLRADLAAVINQADGLALKYTTDPMPQEVQDQIAGLLGKSDTIKAQLQLAQKLADGKEFIGEPTHDGVDWRQAAPNEGNAPTDAKGWHNLTVETAFGKKEVRYQVPIATQAKGYADMFNEYLRRGYENVKERWPKEAKTLSEGLDSAGGFLVPPDIQAGIIKKTMGMTAMRPNATVKTTSRDKMQFARRVYNTDDKYTSAARVTWTGEQPASSTTSRVTDPVYGQIDIPVYVAMASMPVTNSVLEDNAYDLEGDVASVLGEANALGEDVAFVSGSGVAQPFGVMTNIDTTNYVASVVSGSGTAVLADGLIALYFGVPAQYRMNAKWIMDSATMQAVEKLKDSQNRYLVQSLINGSLASAQFDTIKGKPVFIDEFMPDIAANAFPILFGDVSGYYIVDRVGYSIQRNTMLYQETDITLFISRKRVGGFPAEAFKMRAQKIST